MLFNEHIPTNISTNIPCCQNTEHGLKPIYGLGIRAGIGSAIQAFKALQAPLVRSEILPRRYQEYIMLVGNPALTIVLLDSQRSNVNAHKHIIQPPSTSCPVAS